MYQTFDPQSRWAKLQQRVSAEEDEQQPLSVHLWAKKRCSLSKRIVFLKDSRSIRNNCMCQWWQLLQTAKRAIIIDRCQSDDTFVVFQPMEIFCFRRNLEFTVFQRCPQSLYLSRASPSTQSNLRLLCWCPVLSRFSSRVQPSDEITRK